MHDEVTWNISITGTSCPKASYSSLILNLSEIFQQFVYKFGNIPPEILSRSIAVFVPEAYNKEGFHANCCKFVPQFTPVS